MIRRIPAYDPDAPAIVIDVGNTSIGIATWHQGQVKTPLAVPAADEAAFGEAFRAHCAAFSNGRVAAVVIGSVVPKVLERLCGFVRTTLDREALVVGDTVPLPMDVGVDDRRAIGVDRVCAAAAAFDRLQISCVVVDFGTAVTVDLIDDEGTLLGGAILPGMRLQMQALHEHTALLPLVQPAVPGRPYGRNTVEAIQIGVCRGLSGAVRAVVESYATSLNRWPQVVATGGDLEFLAPFCDFLDSRVPHLVLRGVGVAYTQHLQSGGT